MIHTALDVQVREGDICPRYVIELTDFVGDEAAAARVGQIQTGFSGPPGTTLQHLAGRFWGRAYGIRCFRGGRIVDVETALFSNRLSVDCEKARCVVESVPLIQSIVYASRINGDLWTSNSIPAFLLAYWRPRHQRRGPPRAPQSGGQATRDVAVYPRLGGWSASWKDSASAMRRHSQLADSMLALLPLVAALSGCGTLLDASANLSNHRPPRIYGGVRFDVATQSRNGPLHPPFAYRAIFLLDIPFSFLLDTTLLTVTIPAWCLSED